MIDVHTSASTTLWRENMTLSAMNRGLVAAVIDGACRDVPKIRRLRLTVVCRGIVPNIAAIFDQEKVNIPIQCGGLSVMPGDIVVTDESGVVVAPLANCEEIVGKAEQLLETEHVLQDRLRAGGTIEAHRHRLGLG